MRLLLAGNSMLLIAFSVLTVGNQAFRGRQEHYREVATLGERVIGELSSPLAEGDLDAVREILSWTDVDPFLISAELFGRNDRLLAQHRPQGRETARPRLSAIRMVTLPVERAGRPAGRLVLTWRQPLFRDLAFPGVLLALALLALALLGVTLSRRVKTLISDPIGELTGKMEIVSKQQDYQVRVEGLKDDELGVLFACFNEMLAEIEVRDERLALHSEELQLEVAERTRELSNVNRQLAASLDDVRRAMETAQAASRAKSEFLAQMSHEIRTPMYGVLGMTELLQGTDLSKEQSRFVETVRRSGQALLSIINNILDFSKIEAGRMELEIIPFDLHELVMETVELFSEDASKKGLDLRCEITGQLPRDFQGDPGRLRQVIVNLLGNALKFTHKGSVTLLAFMERAPDIVRISVTDTGIGIAPEAQQLIFTQFSQGDQSMTRKYGGTGLGLAIAKQLTELMGGEIRVASEPGKGSTFSFTVRLDSGPEKGWVRPEHSRAALRGKRALVACSDPGTSEFLGAQLKGWGVDYEISADGPGAVCRVVSAPFDLAILDQQISGADGTRLAATLRSLPSGRLVRLVLIGNPDLASLIRDGEEGGLVALPKNELRPHRLYTALVKALGMDQTAGEPEGVEARRTPPQVLLVEDNPVNQEVGRGMLESLACNVEIVANGLMAVEAVQRSTYDLVLMDYQMPVMDGLEAIKTIRDWEATLEGDRKRIPIVSLTACAMAQDRMACMDAGADDYLSKPFTRDELSRVIGRTLQGGSPGRPAAGEQASQLIPEAAPQKPAPAAMGQVPLGHPSPPGSPVDAAQARISASLAAATAGSAPSADASQPIAHDQMSGALEMIRSLPGNRGKEVLRKVVDLYLASTPTLLQTMKEAESGGDAEKLKAAAHSFKSSSANLGAMRLADVCKELEALGRQGSTEGALPLLVRVEEEYRVVREALQGGRI